MPSMHIISNGFIPFPSTPFKISSKDRNEDIANKLDQLFDEISACYPPHIRKELERMYYDGKNVGFRNDLLKNSHAFGMHDKIIHNGQIEFIVIADSTFQKTPLFLKLLLIHEIAIHIGQSYMLAEEVMRANGGCAPLSIYDRWFHQFSELAAAQIDKLIIDAIPIKAWKEDLSEGKMKHIKPTLERIRKWRGMSYEDYTSLQHRINTNEGDIADATYQTFICRQDVCDFIKQIYSLSVEYSDRALPPLALDELPCQSLDGRS